MEALADGDRLLPDREMGRTAMVVDDARVGAFALDAVEHSFEFKDTDYVPIDAEQVFAANEKPLFPNRKGSGFRGYFCSGDRVDSGSRLVLGNHQNDAILIADDVDVAVLVFADGADWSGRIDK